MTLFTILICFSRKKGFRSLFTFTINALTYTNVLGRLAHFTQSASIVLKRKTQRSLVRGRGTSVVLNYSLQLVGIIFPCTLLLISSYSKQHVPVILTLLILIHLILSNMSASFFSVRFLSLLILSNRSASFFFLLFLFPLTLSNRSASFFTLLFSSHLTLINRSASFFSLLFSSHPSFSNGPSSFFSLLFLSWLTLSNRSASFFTLLFSSRLTHSNRSASFFTLLISFYF